MPQMHSFNPGIVNYDPCLITVDDRCNLILSYSIIYGSVSRGLGHGSGEWGLLALYGHEETLKKFSSPKLLVRF